MKTHLLIDHKWGALFWSDSNALSLREVIQALRTHANELERKLPAQRQGAKDCNPESHPPKVSVTPGSGKHSRKPTEEKEKT